MLRKTHDDSVLRFKNERISSGIRERNGYRAATLCKVNGYPPENMAIERICSGIRRCRGLETVDFLIFFGIKSTEMVNEWGSLTSFPH